jgi:hypothetical protein
VEGFAAQVGHKKMTDAKTRVAKAIFKAWAAGQHIGEEVPVVRPISWDDAFEATRRTFLIYADAALEELNGDMK